MYYFYIAFEGSNAKKGNKFFFIICVFRIVSLDAILFLSSHTGLTSL